MRGNRNEPQRSHRRRVAALALALATVAVLLSPLVWWWSLERRLGAEAETRAIGWARDLRAAETLLAVAPESLPVLLGYFPHLNFQPAPVGAAPRWSLDPQVIQAYAQRDAAALRLPLWAGLAALALATAALLALRGILRAERELERRQQNFLSAVSHEFKTPIGTLRLLVQTLRMRPGSAERTVDYLRRMETELDRLERTSEQVLASARLQSAGAAPVLEAAELNSLVQGLVGRVREGLEARGARLRLVYAPEALPVSLEPEAFAIALNNLLDNAVKYSPGAQKPITLSLAADGDLVRLHVDDEGPGLPEAERRKIWEAFYRAGDEMTRTSAGVGLGLHLTRSIVESMHGWVQVGDNPVGHGSRFSLVLPRRVGADPETSAPALEVAADDLGADLPDLAEGRPA